MNESKPLAPGRRRHSRPGPFDIIVGADGGGSSIRPVVTDQQAVYAGYTVGWCRLTQGAPQVDRAW